MIRTRLITRFSFLKKNIDIKNVERYNKLKVNENYYHLKIKQSHKAKNGKAGGFI